MSVPWIAVPPGALLGEGLVPYPVGESGTLFDWAENPATASTHLMPHAGEFLVDIVDIEANAVHQPCKPDDEIVFVAAGRLCLTTDCDGSELAIPAGDMVFIPRGWAGIYRADPGSGRFIEVAVVPHDYFDTKLTRSRSDAAPVRIELPSAPGQHVLSYGSYSIIAHNGDAAGHRRLTCDHDTLLRVMAGRLTISSHDHHESFRAGRFIVLPRGFDGDIEVTPDFSGIALSRPPAPFS